MPQRAPQGAPLPKRGEVGAGPQQASFREIVALRGKRYFWEILRDTVTEDQQVSEEVRKEQVEAEGDR